MPAAGRGLTHDQDHGVVGGQSRAMATPSLPHCWRRVWKPLRGRTAAVVTKAAVNAPSRQADPREAICETATIVDAGV
jgi:hypothetical protein